MYYSIFVKCYLSIVIIVLKKYVICMIIYKFAIAVRYIVCRRNDKKQCNVYLLI